MTNRQRPMTVIHFVRHGDVHNPQKILYARLPRFRLSDVGRSQAAAAGDYLKTRPLTAVYSSPMLRARQTAQAIAAHHPDAPLRISRLITETHTPYEGASLQDLLATDWNLFEGIPPEYEQTEDIFARASRFIRRVRRQHPNEEVAAVSHGHILLWMHLWMRDLPFNMDTQFMIDPFPETASITTLTFSDGVEKPTSLSYHRPY